MYLADTSAWVEYNRPKPRRVGVVLRDLLESDTAVFVTGIIVQELLQGARDELRCRRLWDWLRPQRWIAPKDEFATFAEAGRRPEATRASRLQSASRRPGQRH